jgi:tetratricopeptide (TPR) repeat protein
VEWIARERPAGPVYHHMASGGYLLDRLWPDYRDMVDGRLEVFGPEAFARLQVGGPERFRELDAQYRFGVALLQYSLFDSREILWWLHLNPNWRLVHVDDSAAVFVREAPGARRWASPDVGAPDLFAPLAERRSTDDRLRRQARVSFLLAMRQYGAALAVWERAIALHPELRRERVIHAWLLRQNGLAGAAEAMLQEELTARPQDAGLRAQLGDLRLEAGDPGGARALYDEALAIDPNDAYALQRRAGLAEAEGDLVGAEHYGERLRALARPGAGLLDP